MRIDLTMLFISSYFPLYGFILYLKWDKLLNDTLENYTSMSALLMYALVSGLIITLITAFYIKFKNNSTNVKSLVSIERENDSIMNYIFTYVIPLIAAFDEGESDALIVVNILLFLLVWILYIRLRVLHLNPLLALMGFLPYKINDGILITDMSYNQLLEYKKLNLDIKGESIDPGLFLARKKDNMN